MNLPYMDDTSRASGKSAGCPSAGRRRARPLRTQHRPCHSRNCPCSPEPGLRSGTPAGAAPSGPTRKRLGRWMRAGRMVGSANLRALLVDHAGALAPQLKTGDDRRVTEVLVRNELGLCEPPLGKNRKAGRPRRETTWARWRFSTGGGNTQSDHGEAPAGEGPKEGTSYYRGFNLLHPMIT